MPPSNISGAPSSSIRPMRRRSAASPGFSRRAATSPTRCASTTRRWRSSPAPDLTRRRAALRERIELAALPDEYRAIPEAPQITRGDLAALIGVRLGPVLRQSRDAVVVTDLRSHWAGTWINDVVRAGVMQAFENHTFQPRAAGRAGRPCGHRCAAAGRHRAAASASASGARPRIRFPDVPTGHLAYPAASLAVASGVIDRSADGASSRRAASPAQRPSQAVERLRAMTSLGPSSSVRR